MPLSPHHRRWVLVVVIYDIARVLHLDAFRDSVLAAVVAKVLNGKVKRK